MCDEEEEIGLLLTRACTRTPQGDLGRIREVYERAIAHVPPVREKR